MTDFKSLQSSALLVGDPLDPTGLILDVGYGGLNPGISVLVSTVVIAIQSTACSLIMFVLTMTSH